jgi:hypothetical protein
MASLGLSTGTRFWVPGTTDKIAPAFVSFDREGHYNLWPGPIYAPDGEEALLAYATEDASQAAAQLERLLADWPPTEDPGEIHLRCGRPGNRNPMTVAASGDETSPQPVAPPGASNSPVICSPSAVATRGRRVKSTFRQVTCLTRPLTGPGAGDRLPWRWSPLSGLQIRGSHT